MIIIELVGLVRVADGLQSAHRVDLLPWLENVYYRFHKKVTSTNMSS